MAEVPVFEVAEQDEAGNLTATYVQSRKAEEASRIDIVVRNSLASICRTQRNGLFLYTY